VGPALGYSRENIEAALEAVERERNEFAAEGSPLPDALETTCCAFKGNVILRCLPKPSIKRQKDETDEAWEKREAKHLTSPSKTDPWLNAEQLLQIVQANVSNFPYTNPRSFGQAIKNEQAALRVRGIKIEKRDGHGSKRLYRISWSGK
jgi:hypothetical protein